MDELEAYAIADALLRSGKSAQAYWESAVRLVMPKMLNTAEKVHNGEADEPSRRVCDYAATAVAKCSAAHLSLITPMSSKWFMYESRSRVPDGVDTTDADKWFNECSEIAARKLLQSNFYTEVCSTYNDRVTTGTGLLLCEEDENGELVFTHVPAGTYGIAENNLHEVDKVARSLNYTAAQIVQEWGEDALTEHMRRAWERPESRYVTEFEIWHLVVPRMGAIRANSPMNPISRMWVSVYIDKKSKSIIHESGYFEFPFMCTRFERHGNDVYGSSPLVRIENTIKDKNNMSELLIVGGQRSTFPSYCIPAALQGEVDLSVAGETIIPDEYTGSDFPRVVAPATRYDIGKDLVEDYKSQIDDALFVSVFQNISQQERYMTATEVQARQSEKLQYFTPSYCQCTTDYRPLHNRIFCILARNGSFDMSKAPQGILQEVSVDGFEGYKIISPSVNYVGMMAQAFARAQGQDAQQAITDIINVAQSANDVNLLLHVDLEAWARMRLIQSNAPSSLIRATADVEERRQAMQAASQQQAQMDMAVKEAAANRDTALANQANAQATRR